MGYKWRSTKFRGVRYREHQTRKHGVLADRYFAIRYQVDGERREEGLGWASEGWSASKAALELASLKEAAKTGAGPVRLAEKRALADAERRAQQEEQENLARESITFGDFWRETYFPLARSEKTTRTWKREDQFFRLWMGPVFGDLPIKQISPLHLERLKKNMADASRSPRTIKYCLDVTRQVFNHAIRLGLFKGPSPTSKVKKPKVDNRRLRFLTPEEAGELLEALSRLSRDLHDQALLSLHCGLRAGEIFSLTWGDVDLAHGVLTLRDTKGGTTRQAFLTAPTKAILSTKGGGQPNDLVFPTRGGQLRQQISRVFRDTVNKLRLNEGVTDRRQRVTFHTLRHTFASWLVMEGIPLYTVQKLMGHSTIAMTERYAHLAPDHMKDAVSRLERKAKPKRVTLVHA